MTIEEMKARKRELGLSNEKLSQLSGVPFSTIQKVFSGTTTAPRQATIQALEAVLRTSPVSAPGLVPGEPVATLSGFRHDDKTFSSAAVVRETAAAYHRTYKGEYTLDDYYALPDERRVELIDGEFFDMAAPSALHQLILGELYQQFRTCAAASGKHCLVFLSPCDVQLDNDNKTMIQPDLFVLCRNFDLEKRSIDGAPDLTLEILSDSTRSKDLLLKTYKYKNAGVKEYWIVDPLHRRVLVYDFSRSNPEPAAYTFFDQIPICISEGRCSIDFSEICQNLGL